MSLLSASGARGAIFSRGMLCQIPNGRLKKQKTSLSIRGIENSVGVTGKTVQKETPHHIVFLQEPRVFWMSNRLLNFNIVHNGFEPNHQASNVTNRCQVDRHG